MDHAHHNRIHTNVVSIILAASEHLIMHFAAFTSDAFREKL